jgi:hypothetical protein
MDNNYKLTPIEQRMLSTSEKLVYDNLLNGVPKNEVAKIDTLTNLTEFQVLVSIQLLSHKKMLPKELPPICLNKNLKTEMQFSEDREVTERSTNFLFLNTILLTAISLWGLQFPLRLHVSAPLRRGVEIYNDPYRIHIFSGSLF